MSLNPKLIASITVSLITISLLSGCSNSESKVPLADKIEKPSKPAVLDLVTTINEQNASLRISPVAAPRILGYSLFAAYSASMLMPKGLEKELVIATAGSEVAATMILDPSKATELRSLQERYGAELYPASKEFGLSIAAKVLKIAAEDKYRESWSSWEPTDSGTTRFPWRPTGRGEPGFEPGWGILTPLNSDSNNCVLPAPNAELVVEQAKQMYSDFNVGDALGADVLWWLAGIATSTPAGQWMRIAVNAALDDNMSSEVALRMLTLAAMSAHDAGVLGWREKYRHNLARPETLWIELYGPNNKVKLPRDTPNHPSYPSGHSVFGGAVANSMILSRGDNPVRDFLPVDLYAPYETRSWQSTSGALREANYSRVNSGFHYPVDVEAGASLGKCVAESMDTNLDKLVEGL